MYMLKSKSDLLINAIFRKNNIDNFSSGHILEKFLKY